MAINYRDFAASIILCATLLLFFTSIGQTQQSSQVVAEVDGVAITRAQLERATAESFGLDLHAFADENLHVVRKRVLERLVERELLQQAARRVYGEMSGTTTSAISRYVNAEVLSGVTVTPEECLAYYRENSKEFTAPVEFELREIAIFAPEGDTQAERQAARVRIERLRSALLTHESRFSEYARQNSQASSAARGGLRGFVALQQLEPEVAEVVAVLSDRTLSSVIETSEGFHLVYIESRRGGEQAPYEQVAERIAAQILRRKQEKAFEQHLQELKTQRRVIVYYN